MRLAKSPPPRLSDLDQLEALYAGHGHLSYGEGVTQLEHALQCADLAEQAGAAPSLMLAALLHDIGHLFATDADDAASDQRHEIVGARALSGLFGEAVRAPIALHVAAKRYLCFAEPAYAATLSAASQATLVMQGGVFDARAAAAFEGRPYWREAVALRRFDDTGKRGTPSGRRFSDFRPLMRALQTADA